MGCIGVCIKENRGSTGASACVLRKHDMAQRGLLRRQSACIAIRCCSGQGTCMQRAVSHGAGVGTVVVYKLLALLAAGSDERAGVALTPLAPSW